MKKILFLVLFSSLSLFSQTQLLPVVNILTVNGVSCSFTVIDNISSVATECIQVSDGSIIVRSVHTPQLKGAAIGSGPILCLLWKTTTTPPAVNLQCTTDDDSASGPKLALNGVLPTVTKLRKWWILWN